MVRTMLPGGCPSPTRLTDVIGTILDKGPVIGAWLRAALAGVGALMIDARIVVASVDTYLRFAEAANQLAIAQEKAGLPGLAGGSQQSSARRNARGVLQEVGDKLREFAEPEGRPVSGRLRSREGS